MTKAEIVEGLRALGVKPGDILMVHSALSSLGWVEGGADTVIDALIEAVGPGGTIAMPTLYLPSISGLEVFDVNESPSQMGEISEIFRRRQGVVRSVHPTHPVAAYGFRAEDLIRDHALAPTACGQGTPFSKLADWGGKVLLLGVDQDRSTLLHTAEDYADSPYLTTKTARYRDPFDGEVKELILEKFPGPHRNFIGLDPLFRAEGVMTIGKVGKAVCRLMYAAATIKVAVKALQDDPAAVLCDNPNCADCVHQRGAIRNSELAAEDFTLSVRIDQDTDVPALSTLLWRYGITNIEIGESWLKQVLKKDLVGDLKQTGLAVTGIDVSGLKNLDDALKLAAELECNRIITAPSDDLCCNTGKINDFGMSLLVRNQAASSVGTAESTKALADLGLGLAFDPSEFAAAGQNPFLTVYYHGIKKGLVQQLYVKDGLFSGEPAEPGLGNGEVKELISILRCRSFDGPMVIWPRESIESSCEAFWGLMREM
ncbi:MAG TPA: AAC(3) family N-acetyltransferase [Armatimonadota bacterium]|nr:AAC(3) family N-acetyltransferase [Armatimonadota bacterium]